MKRIHVKNSMKKILAFSLAAVMTVPSVVMNGTISASAEEVSVPQPAKTISLEKGFEKDGLSQAKFGQLIGFVEEDNVYDTKTARALGTYKKVDKVLVQGTFDATKLQDSTRHTGYVQADIPKGKEQQFLPYIAQDTGKFISMNCAWNQPTTAYDPTKGMVFWLDDTITNQSYPTYATTVDEETGIPKTEMNVIVKDAEGRYMEYEVNNSAAEFESPFKGSSAAGLTFSAWIKNTTPYKAPVVYTILGDLDGDGEVLSKDALVVLKHSLGIEVLDEVGVLYANVNGDTTTVDGVEVPCVDSKDALDILKKSLKIIDEFAGSEPENVVVGEEEVEPLKDSEFFHIERRVTGKSYNDMTKKEEDDERNITEREYLYFSGNGITYVGDWTDESTVCTWTLPEDKMDDQTVNLLNGRNGSKWIYVSYTFDGTDFHMYLDGTEVPLEKNAGEKYATANIMKLVSNKDAVTYLGGRGGGLKDNYNKYKIQTSSDYYMDDIAIYTSALSSAQVEKAASNAAESLEAAQNRSYTTLKTYSFDGATLQDNEMTAVEEADSKRLPIVDTDGKYGKGIQLKKGNSSKTGGVKLSENPFAGKSDLTGVSISYWIKAKDNGFGAVTDGMLLAFIDDEKTCGTDKVGTVTGKSQIYLNIAFGGGFNEAVTNVFGTGNLKNTFSFKPYPYGDPKDLTVEKKNVEVYDAANNKSYYDDWVQLKNRLKDDWNFVTVTFNNSGFTMYLNGVEVQNRWMDYRGARFCDYYHGRLTELEPQFTRKATNNAGARSLMDFITAEDTKAYVGFGYAINSAKDFMSTQECFLDELSFYDKDLTAAEVRALYNSVK